MTSNKCPVCETDGCGGYVGAGNSAGAECIRSLARRLSALESAPPQASAQGTGEVPQRASLCPQDPCSGTHDTAEWRHRPRDTKGTSWIGLTDWDGNKLPAPVQATEETRFEAEGELVEARPIVPTVPAPVAPAAGDGAAQKRRGSFWVLMRCSHCDKEGRSNEMLPCPMHTQESVCGDCFARMTADAPDDESPAAAPSPPPPSEALLPGQRIDHPFVEGGPLHRHCKQCGLHEDYHLLAPSKPSEARERGIVSHRQAEHAALVLLNVANIPRFAKSVDELVRYSRQQNASEQAAQLSEKIANEQADKLRADLATAHAVAATIRAREDGYLARLEAAHQNLETARADVARLREELASFKGCQKEAATMGESADGK